MTTTTPDYTTTTLGQITVEKTTLLTKLRDNRQTHKEIYDAACAGFWVQASEKLERRKERFTTATAKAGEVFDKQYATFGLLLEAKDRHNLGCFDNVTYQLNLNDFDPCWVPSFPTQHLDDYDRAILMLELSVAEKVSLSVNEFDAYARNNWKWKDDFASTNLDFVKCVTGSMFATAVAAGVSGGFMNSSVYRYAANDGKDL